MWGLSSAIGFILGDHAFLDWSPGLRIGWWSIDIHLGCLTPGLLRGRDLSYDRAVAAVLYAILRSGIWDFPCQLATSFCGVFSASNF